MTPTAICIDSDFNIRSRVLTGAAWIAVLVLGFGGWSMMTSLTSAVIATGQVDVVDSSQIVQHLQGGIVSKILVRNGDHVRQGQVLMLLDGTTAEADRAVAQSQMIETTARIARLRAQQTGSATISFPQDLLSDTSQAAVAAMAAQDDLFQVQTTSLQQKITRFASQKDQYLAQIDGSEAQRIATVKRIDLLDVQLKKSELMLEKGLVIASKVSDLKFQRASLDGQNGALMSQTSAGKSHIAEIDQQITQLTTDVKETAQTELQDLIVKQDELRQKLGETSAQVDRLNIKAPTEGIVHNMTVTTLNSVIKPAEAVMFIIPQDRALTIKARVDPTDIDLISVGQEAQLIFPAFKSNDLDIVTGTLTMVSPNILTDSRTGASWYEVDVKISDASVSALHGKELMPGMPASVYIKTGEQTPFEYLLAPLTTFMRGALRETT